MAAFTALIEEITESGELVDCDSVERAVELASRFPDARYGAVEVRPIMDMSGLEM